MNYEEILKFINYPTIKRLFEIEGLELTPFVLGGVAYIIKHTLNLTDCGNNTLSDKEGNSMIKYYTTFEFVKDRKVENIVDLGDVIKVKVLESRISVASAKVLYIEINKKLIK